jgi:hypothetical protein
VDIVNLIGGLFSGSLVEIILKLVLGLGVGAAVIVFYVWFNNKLKEAAHKKTMEDRAKEQADLDQENRDIFDDARKSKDEIEELIRKKRR